TFIINASMNGPICTALYGFSGGWAGTRTTPQLVEKFPNPQGTVDKRAMFWTQGHTLSINDVAKFENGYAVIKFQNKDSKGVNGSDPTFPDTDFPMFRLADVYLMYAEAVLRGGTGGSRGQALTYINAIRQRAYGSAAGNISDAEMTLDFILDERARELYWECHRRTDLIRFGKFTTGNYLWEWKGGVKGGRATEAKYNIFPIPAADLNVNPNLKQNPGY
ncbi:MAG: RagB/SusD family nutrient uptake outer membrane protein, partial [Flammeovirgaceae bacterium]|nr:RagB/SusD family nutrient uptake outer membrane protein [Flammeovirgaceae bacterium]MDW8286823.1 RagB/SusD family nutrient uptake outer membrane protein [Flammeovirgaceae bacterium]